MTELSAPDSKAPSPARVAAVMVGVPAAVLAAMLALALGPHAGMLTGVGHAMMRAAADIVLGGDGVGMQ